MKRFLISISVAALVASSAVAGGNSNTGCGLGSMAIKNQDTLVLQLAGTFLNGISGNQTFGITSGSLGCSKPTKIVMNDQAQKFVADNMDSIAIEVAAGEGENLDTLLSLIEVEDKAVAALTLKANFSTIYSSADVTSAQVVDGIVDAL
jgi:hypothetical protein